MKIIYKSFPLYELLDNQNSERFNKKRYTYQVTIQFLTH